MRRVAAGNNAGSARRGTGVARTQSRFFGALLAAAALLGAGRAEASVSICVIVIGAEPPPLLCPDGSPLGPLAQELDDLREALSPRPGPCESSAPPTACSESRTCAQAVSRLEAAFGAACEGEAARGLSQAAQAVAQLERGRAISSLAQLGAVESLVEAAEELVADRREDVDDALGRLCTSARSRVAQSLRRAEQAVSQAQAYADRDALGSALRSLASAASGFDSAEKTAASNASRCRPRACRSNQTFALEPGLASNESLELVPPDRGLVAAYRISGDDVASGGAVGGRLRLAWSSLTQARVQAEISAPLGSVGWTGSFSTSACLDPQGWYRLAKVSESLRFAPPARGSAGGGVSFAPGAVSVAPVGLVPVVPRAVAVRVGDRVEEPSLQVGGRVAGGTVRDACQESHRVVAIEDVQVPAGTFEAARVESSFHCASGLHLDSVAWLASGVGFARAELRDEDTSTLFELECFETPETAGRCTPVTLAPAPGSGLVIQALPALPASAGAEIHAVAIDAEPFVIEPPEPPPGP
jgi:hypothetical protein